MSVRLVTTPWLTKNFAGGWLDTRRLLGGRKGTDRCDGTAPWLPRRPEKVPRAGGRHAAGRRRGPRIIGAMLLALDIGNTNVTLGLFRAGALLATRRAATDPRATNDEFALLLDGLLRLDGIAAADIDAVALASVVPSLTDAVAAFVERHEASLLVAGAGTIPIAV